MSRIFGLTLAAVAVVALVAACSGTAAGPRVATLDDPSTSSSPGASPGASAAVTPQDAALAFARCMRENGIDMPDPIVTTDGDGGTKIDQRGGAGVNTPAAKEKFNKAEEACRKHLAAAGPGGPGREMSAEDMDKLLAFAKCMREHGIDFPDPTADGGFVMRVDESGGPNGAGGGSTKGGPDDPKFQAAETACSSLLPGKPSLDGNDGPPPPAGGSTSGAASTQVPQ
jgi:hypothetical protein